MQLQCSTCIGSVQEIACYDWRICRNFAKAKRDGTLPVPFPKIGADPTEADR
jgi:hypothetical protein